MRLNPADRLLLAFSAGGGAVLVWLALVEAPSFAGRSGFSAPLAWKLFFFHVPIAFVTFVAFGIAVLHSTLHFLRPHPTRDERAQAAVEVGVLFAALTLATGMIWGRAEWGVAWRWDDAKLVVVLLMFLLYAAYLVLRREIADPDLRGRVAAVYAIGSFLTVPLAWFAQRIWLSYHPVVFGASEGDAGVVTAGILPILLLGIAVFLCVALFLYRWRRSLLHLWAELDELETAEAVPA